MLSIRTVEPHTLELLKHLMAVPELAQTRLVGGTSLALQYGHRQSIDLDLFGLFDTETDFGEIFSETMGCRQISVSRNIKVFEINGVKVDLVNYKYPWIDNVVFDDGIRLASPLDIAAMKVNAIEGRGSRKDFVDIFFLLQRYSLQEILEFYKQKYPEHSTFRALMSMMYFDDAEQQPMPRMFADVTWEEMRTAIQKAVREFEN